VADAGGDVGDVEVAPAPGQRLGVAPAVAGRAAVVRGQDGPAPGHPELVPGPPGHGRGAGRAAVDVDDHRGRRSRAEGRGSGPVEQAVDRTAVLARPADRLRFDGARRHKGPRRAGRQHPPTPLDVGVGDHHRRRCHATGADGGDPRPAPVEEVVPGLPDRPGFPADGHDDEAAEARLVAAHGDQGSRGRPGVGPLPGSPRRLGVLVWLLDERLRSPAVGAAHPDVHPAGGVGDERQRRSIGRETGLSAGHTAFGPRHDPGRAGRPQTVDRPDDDPRGVPGHVGEVPFVPGQGTAVG
jgi:hypothetical protein